jgi:hypothetical protein
VKHKTSNLKPLSSTQIQKILQDTKGFIGVYPHDRLPILTQKQKKNPNISFVINYDNYDGPGTHWVCVYGRDEFYDSFGIVPSDIIQLWFRNTYKLKHGEIKYPNHKMQNTYSNLCGYFCCDFIKKRAGGMTFDDIIHKHFNPKSTLVNEEMLHNKYK